MPWPDGVGRQILEEVDSTNAEALRQAGKIATPCWILGLRQTRGRGRRGRPWQDPTGNFAATLLLQPQEAADVAALRSFVAALALGDALSDVAGPADPAARVAMKWPNDVLLNGGKVAGILLEASSQSGRVSHLAIGIGVNLISAPMTERLEGRAVAPVSILSETGQRIVPEAFLCRLANAYARRERQFTDFGFEPIRTAWLERAARLGERIVARSARAETSGLFRDVDRDGALVLDTGTGQVRVTAAEVFY